MMGLTSPGTGCFWHTCWSSGPRSEDVEAETSIGFICTEIIIVLMFSEWLVLVILQISVAFRLSECFRIYSLTRRLVSTEKSISLYAATISNTISVTK
jgi:hypothetical protein